MTGTQNARPSMFSVFKNHSFTFIWVGQLINGMSNLPTTQAASILVYRLQDRRSVLVDVDRYCRSDDFDRSICC